MGEGHLVPRVLHLFLLAVPSSLFLPSMPCANSSAPVQSLAALSGRGRDSGFPSSGTTRIPTVVDPDHKAGIVHMRPSCGLENLPSVWN